MNIFVIGVGALLLILGLIKIAISLASEMGKLKADQERIENDMDLAKKRAEELLKDKTRAETVNDLRNNKF